MIEIHAQDVETFVNGWKVAIVTKPGAMKVPTKGEGGLTMVEQPFRVGDAVLVGGSGNIVVAPLSFEGAKEIARKVIECDPTTVTDSHSLRALATAVIGFDAQTVSPDPVRETVVSDGVAGHG